MSGKTLDFSNMGNPWRFVSSPDFHIKGTIQSAELKIDLDRKASASQQGRTTVTQEREGGGSGPGR